jgi:hypothetical protein
MRGGCVRFERLTNVEESTELRGHNLLIDDAILQFYILLPPTNGKFVEQSQRLIQPPNLSGIHFKPNLFTGFDMG